MKKSIKLAAALVCFSLTFPIYAKDAQESATVAVVNGTSISQESLEGYINVLKRSSPAPVDVTSALDDLVVTEIAIQQAEKAGLTSRDDVKARIKDATRKILLTVWTQEKSQGLDISNDEIKTLYDESMKEQAHQEFKARHILVKTEEEAKAIIKSLDDGGDFIAIAKEKSIGPSKVKGGDLGWFKATTMVPTFAKAVAKMEAGKYTKEAVKTNFGWHVIKLEEKREAKLPSLKQMESQMKSRLIKKKMIALIEGLKEKADVKITIPKSMLESDDVKKDKPEDKK